MPRSVRDSALETRSARSRLRARDWPYYRALEPGLHLGYRKPLAGAGVWVRRRYDSEAKHYRTDSLATADDYADADGREVLNFAQAQRKARAHRVAKSGITVADALDAYLHHLEADGRSAAALRDARYRDDFIRSQLGSLELQALPPIGCDAGATSWPNYRGGCAPLPASSRSTARPALATMLLGQGARPPIEFGRSYARPSIAPSKTD